MDGQLTQQWSPEATRVGLDPLPGMKNVARCEQRPKFEVFVGMSNDNEPPEMRIGKPTYPQVVVHRGVEVSAEQRARNYGADHYQVWCTEREDLTVDEALDIARAVAAGEWPEGLVDQGYMGLWI